MHSWWSSCSWSGRHASMELLSQRIPGKPMQSVMKHMALTCMLAGSGPVDVPNSYFGFQVGPAIIGCFMLPMVGSRGCRRTDGRAYGP